MFKLLEYHIGANTRHTNILLPPWPSKSNTNLLGFEIADDNIYSEFKPLHNVCEFLNALHIYTDEAKQRVTRYVEANHYCSLVRKDLRQCLIYDSHEKDARLIGVEYMVPRHVYEILDPKEQKLW
jgi:hypothetical protein